MTYSPHNVGSRNCFRCSLPLTDAASLNEGVGPVCRKLDNALLARLIPADIQEALEAYAKVDVLALSPETIKTFLSLEGALRADAATSITDWRTQAKQVEWMLSFSQKPSNQQALKDIVSGLGYTGLVNLWNGEAATGLAQTSFENGRLIVRGPRNKGVAWAFKQIPGYKFLVPAYAAKGGWSVPAEKWAQFQATVASRYPNNQGLSEAVEAAKAYLASPAAKEATTAPKVAAATLCQVGDVLKVRTPYNGQFIGALKEKCPYNHRKWNPTEKVWEIAATFRSDVEKLLTTHFHSWAEAA